MPHGLAATALRPATGFAVALALAFGLPSVLASPLAPGDGEALSCRDCHEEVVDAAPKSIHGKVLADPALDGCGMCHIGIEGHLQFVQGAGEKRPPLSGFTKPADCLLCHATIRARHEKAMPAWKERKDAACTTCHDPHADAEAVKKARTAGPFESAKALEEAGAKPAPGGTSTCAKCHDAPVKTFEESAHRKAGATCEACHGDGSLHAAAGGVKRLILPFDRKDPAASARFCLACHEKSAPDHAKEFAASRYSEGGKTCASCHQVHAPAAPPGPKEGFARYADAVKGAVNVGSAKCAQCHASPHPDLAKSRHAPLMAAGREGCEGCHGPGSAHAASSGRKNLILAPKRLAAADRDALCLRCHRATSSPAAWAGAPHGAAGMACLQCHDTFGPPGQAARKPEPDLCAKCHGVVAAQFKMPNHHPVPEGALQCSDCHDLHRPAPAVFSAKKWTDTCAKCHRSESSPRLHPHEAGRADGCIVCHEPHGSPSPRLLRFGRTVDLCLSCHIPPASHDLSPGSAYASCLACHTEIHGSDADPKLLR